MHTTRFMKWDINFKIKSKIYIPMELHQPIWSKFNCFHILAPSSQISIKHYNII